MTPLRCGVIGTGYLGRFHAEKYALLDECSLTAVVDIDPDAAHAVAKRHGAAALTDYRDLLGQVDAVSVVVPTRLHHEVTRAFLEAGAHVLVEKPMTVTLEEADDLIGIAERGDRILQVGHLERFNAAVRGLGLADEPPLFIESHRLSPFNPRATDVSVVLDLMIHDIDIILDMMGSEVERIDASGTPVLTDDLDIANARLTFRSGGVANVTASRVSMKTERKMRLFRPRSYVSIDFQNRTLVRHQTGTREMFPGIPEIETEESVFENGDALLDEIRDFVGCIRERRQPLVSGRDGRRALATAIEIGRLLER